MPSIDKPISGEILRSDTDMSFEWSHLALYVCKCGAGIDLWLARSKYVEIDNFWHAEHDGFTFWEEPINTDRPEIDEALAVVDMVQDALTDMDTECGWSSGS